MGNLDQLRIPHRRFGPGFPFLDQGGSLVKTVSLATRNPDAIAGLIWVPSKQQWTKFVI